MVSPASNNYEIQQNSNCSPKPIIYLMMVIIHQIVPGPL